MARPSESASASVIAAFARRFGSTTPHGSLSGDESAAFAREVCKALQLGVPLLLAHEFPSAIEMTSGAKRGACPFDDFWNEGSTPKYLLQGNTHIYQQLAIALKPGEWRRAGLVRLALEMSNSRGERAPARRHHRELESTSHVW